MSLPLIIYLISVTSSLAVLFHILATIAVGWSFILGITVVATTMNGGEIPSIHLRGLKISCSLVLLFMVLSCVIPSRETSYTMLAAYGVESIVSNEDVQRVGSKSLSLIEKAIDKYTTQGVDSR